MVVAVWKSGFLFFTAPEIKNDGEFAGTLAATTTGATEPDEMGIYSKHL